MKIKLHLIYNFFVLKFKRINHNIQLLFFILLSIFISKIAVCQSPNYFNYQAIVRQSNGEIISNQIVSIKISILSSNITGPVVYSETHKIATNDYGLVNLQIGSGDILQGGFIDIQWSKFSHFIKTEIDVKGGTNYLFMGTSQLMSVPYALNAKTVENNDDGDADPTNEIQTISRIGNNITISNNGGTVSIIDNDNDSINELQKLTQTGNIITLSQNGGIVYLDDNDSTNEIQTLKLNGNKLEISKGNSVILNGAIDLDSDPTNELQTLFLNGRKLEITNGNSIDLPENLDNDSLNEIQNLKLNKDTLFISGANYVKLPTDNDSDPNNEIQMISIKEDTLFISKSNNVKLPKSLDNDSTNEIQSLTIKGDTLFLSKSNFIILNNLQSLTPTGTIIAFAGDVNKIPKGWLLCDGQEVDKLEYNNLYIVIDSIWGKSLDDKKFKIPDLRGYFLRGVSGNSDNDPDKSKRFALSNGNTGNTVGSYQSDELKSHNHTISSRWSGTLSGIGMGRGTGSSSGSTSDFGGSETRPKNAYVNYIIKY